MKIPGLPLRRRPARGLVPPGSLGPIVLLGLLAVVYAPVLAELVRAWLDSEIYRHGFLVPVVAAYLAWRQRDRLAAATLRPAPWGGAAVMLLAAAMLLLGKLGAVIAILEEASLLVMSAGLVLLLGGVGALRILALPLVYLTFMIPLFADGTDWLHWPFQLLAANLGVWLLQTFGFAAFQEAQYIELPRVTLEVAEACSGIRFMISVVAVGIPLAQLTQRTRLRKIALVTAAVVVGILANGIRVALIGVWAYYGGEVLKGPYEVLQGMFVAWVGFLALFVGAWLLARGPGLPSSRRWESAR